jgi:transposase
LCGPGSCAPVESFVHHIEDPTLAIPPELEAQILRYYHVEKWRIGTIASQLHVHHGTVQRVLAQAGLPVPGPPRRSSQLEHYLPFIIHTLEKFPALTASRLYSMVRERGYRGGPDHFRHLIALHRPTRHAEAFLRLRTLPAEHMQIDWAAFGHLTIGRARRALMGFVGVLSFSRYPFLRFFLDARMENFLRGHVSAFEAWGGCARTALYDNLKSAVLERQGDAIRFHPTMLQFAAHYRFEPRPVAKGRGNEKGRVERKIRHIRDNFFAAREFRDIDDLNAQAQQWCQGEAADRPCPEDTRMRVREAFVQEQAHLLALPANPFPTEERVEVKAGKTPYVRFDLNDYSIPHTHVRRSLSVLADPHWVRVLDGTQLIASHPRSYDRLAQIELPAHIEQLVERKRQARAHRSVDRLAHAAPASARLLSAAAERGENLGSITVQLVRLLERFGAAELQAAIEEALGREVPHPSAVRLALERRRELAALPPPVALHLPEHLQKRDTHVQPHELHTYDQLSGETNERS